MANEKKGATTAKKSEPAKVTTTAKKSAPTKVATSAVKKSEPVSVLQKYTSPFDEMERMFDDFLHRKFLFPSWMPRLQFPEFAQVSSSIDMFEEGNELIIKAEIPGMQKNEISIDFSDNVVTISGEKKSEEKTERKDYYRVERSFGSFCRKIRLPVEVQVEKANALYKDGILELRMPKTAVAKQKVSKIAVK